MHESARVHDENYLLALVACAIRQEEIPERWRRRKPDWERVCQLAEYHHVANLLYYKMLGMDGSGLGTYRKRIGGRYMENVRAQDRYRELTARLEQELERRGVISMIAGGNLFVQYYPMSEMRMNEPLQVVTEKRKRGDVCAVMRGLGFERDLEREKEKRKTGRKEGRKKEGWLCFRKAFGPRVEFTEKLIFHSKPVNRWFRGLPRIAGKKRGYRYVRELEPEDQYLYLVCRLAERYARGAIELRDAADLWVFIRAVADRVNWKEVESALESMGVGQFHHYMVLLANRWFGSLQYGDEDNVLGGMRRYILSRGAEGIEESRQLLSFDRRVADHYFRNIKKEEKDQERRWKFPGMEYMQTLYPLLRRLPFLLPVFWILRLVRNGRGAAGQKREDTGTSGGEKEKR